MTKLSKIFIWSAVFVVAIFGLANSSFARTWTQSGPDGLGTTNNSGFYGFEPIANILFTGSYNLAGAEAFSTVDGLTWLPQGVAGFGDWNNMGFNGGHAVYNNLVYTCLQNPVTGTEVWAATMSGVLSVAQVNADGFDTVDPAKAIHNLVCLSLKEFKGSLYAGTTNTVDGGGLFATATGNTWTQIRAYGFGDVNNSSFASLEVFNNYLYLGTNNSVTGAELWRTVDGVIWSRVGSNIFGNVLNTGIISLKSFGSYLYAGTGSAALNPNPAEIWKSSDGVNWTKTGFNGGANNTSIQGMYVAENLLFAGTWNITDGAAIFETSDGETWTQNNVNGFGHGGFLGLIAIRDFGMLGDYLYTGANSLPPFGRSGEIWRADIVAPIVTASPDNKISRKKIKVTLSSNDSSGLIYYTTDGSTPTTSSGQYSKTLTFKKTTVLKFIGVDTEGNISDVSTKYFIVTSYPYLYKATKELREKNGTIKFYNILTSKYGKKFKPFSSGLKYFTVADFNHDNKTEIIATNGSEIKVYSSKRKLKYTLNVPNNYLAFGDIDNSKKEKTLVAFNKTLKIYNKTSLFKTFNFSENIKSVAVGRVLKYDKPLIVVGFDNKIKLYQYKNGSLVLKKTKSLKYSKLLAYDLDTDGLDNLMYSSGQRVYVLNKKLKKKFSFKAGGSFLSVADVNDDYLLEVLASTGKKLKTYSNVGVLLTSKKDKGKWVGVKF